MKEPLEKLWIWQEANELACDIFKLNKNIKEYNLKNQIDRSSLSVVSNIAEMYGAYYYDVKKSSLRISRKEAYETISHLDIYQKRGIFTEDICMKLKGRYSKLIIGINCYIKYIGKSQDEYLKKNKNSV